MGKNDPIDFASALERIGNDESFLKELIDLYIMNFESKREELSSALEKSDFKAIREIGHNLKGSSANLSMIPLQELFSQMEASGKNEDIAKAAETLVRLEREFNRMKDFVQEKG